MLSWQHYFYFLGLLLNQYYDHHNFEKCYKCLACEETGDKKDKSKTTELFLKKNKFTQGLKLKKIHEAHSHEHHL
ncbi:MAG: hypothetical protein CM15mP22_6100 [Gammaproteobacteria bacterium]|nr:MAG: hypothetical protein CM15mP22_6100 [Gammaproteobacteria bacterium]